MTPPGSLLLSVPEMVDPNFEATVVLVCKHDAEGALGLVLNRPLEVRAGQVLQEEPGLGGLEEAIHWGGPVGLERLHVLHDAADPEELSLPVAEGIRFGGDLAFLRRAREEGCRLRFFLGYSGWGEGQLEGELEAGAWRVLPPAAAEVWEEPALHQWERLTAGQDKRYRWMNSLPDDPEVN